ncbi:uncharacterized protein M6G45_016631 [Spheniscus humboldti]
MDDILIATEERLTCIKVTIDLLNFLGLNGYRVSRNKAQIASQTVIYLGFEISKGQRRFGTDRKEAICSIPEPKNVHELRAFLGMAGWCRLWIMNYGLIAKPLYEAQKNVPFVWGPQQQKAFLNLKQALMTAPALGLPDLTKDFQLFVHERQHLALGVLTQKMGSWKRPVGYFSKQLDTEEGQIEHDCLVTIEHVYSSREDLKDNPLEDPDWELYTDGSSFVEDGIRYAGYVVTTENCVVEANSLPCTTSAQKAELTALTRALELSEGKKVNIWTDSKYVFGVVHVHGVLWKERGLLSSQGMSIKYQEEILKLIQAVQKPIKVAIMHCKAHQLGNTKEIIGNKLADRTARRIAKRDAFQMALIPIKTIALPREKPKFSEEDEKLGKLLNAKKNLAGWWITLQGQVVVPLLVMREIIQTKHKECHWGAEALVTFLRKQIVSVKMLEITKMITAKCEICLKNNPDGQKPFPVGPIKQKKSLSGYCRKLS